MIPGLMKQETTRLRDCNNKRVSNNINKQQQQQRERIRKRSLEVTA